MTTLCAIAGTLRDLSGVIMPNTQVTFIRSGVAGQDGSTIIPKTVTVQSDTLGAIAVTLYSGNYTATTVGANSGTVQFAVAVPGTATAVLSNLIDAASIVYMPAAQSASEAAAAAALVSANNAAASAAILDPANVNFTGGVEANVLSVNQPFTTVTLFLADITLSYIAGAGKIVVAAGDIITAQGFRYKVAASTATIVSTANPTGYHVINAGGVKFFVVRVLFYSVSAFGALGDEISDDTLPVQTGILTAQIDGSDLVLDGIFRITSTLEITSRCHLIFTGGYPKNGYGGYGKYSFLKKAATLNGPALLVRNGAHGTVIDGGGIEGEAGNGGDNLVIEGNSTIVNRFGALYAGRDGFRIGSDNGNINANEFYLRKCYAAANGGRGFNVSGQINGGLSNANAGTLDSCDASVNGSDGFYFQNAGANTIINPNSEGNSGWGIYLDGLSQQHTIIGGDSEGNTLGDVYIASTRTVVLGVTDNGTGLIRLQVDTSSGLASGDTIDVNNVAGTIEANGRWVITVIDGTHIDLVASTFINPWVSGGIVNVGSGNHFVKTTYGATFVDNGWATSNLSNKGNGLAINPVNMTGSWNPEVTGSSGAGTTFGDGSYSITGDILTAQFDVSITAIGTLAGNAFISALPFGASSTLGSATIDMATNISLPAGYTDIKLGNYAIGAAAMLIYAFGAGLPALAIPVTSLMVGGASTELRGTIILPVSLI